jgi:hypothetical protein
MLWMQTLQTLDYEAMEEIGSKLRCVATHAIARYAQEST